MRGSSLLWFLLIPLYLGHSAVLELNEETSWNQLVNESERIEVQNELALHDRSVVDPQALELDIGNDVKPGLFPIGAKSTKKTIFLSDGEASSGITYVLNLRSNEKLLSVVHVTNDSKVITSHSKRVREISDTPTARYNISLAHEFEGSVGVASYILHVTTSYARYLSSGTYYVSGIVALVDGKNSSLALVSGMGSPGLSFQDPGSVTLKNSHVGQVPLSIAYQAPGPDVMETSLTLTSVMKSSQFHVQDSGTDSEAPLLSYNQTLCGHLPEIQMDETGYFLFPHPECGIGFHTATGQLVINLNRERNGTVVVVFSIPLLTAHEEVFETSINIFVGAPKIKKPVLLLDTDLDLVLDHYGSEEFSMKMYNTIKPAQPHNATAFYMNLPGMRYATIDFHRSKLVNPIQTIIFKTVPPGQEDEKILKLLKGTLNPVSNYTFVNLTASLPHSSNTSGSEQETVTNSHLPLNVNLSPDEAKEDTSVALRIEADVPLSEELYNDNMFIEGPIYDSGRKPQSFSEDIHQRIVLREDIIDEQSSGVYVVIPPNDLPIRAVSSGQASVRTALASKELAAIDTEESSFPEKVLVTMALEGYSISDFSEYKSEQIKTALLTEALALKNGTEGEIRLVKLRNEGANLIAEYEIFVSDSSVEIADGLVKPDIGTRIAKKAFLEEHRVEIISAMASMFKDVPGNLAGSGNGQTVASASSAALIAAIVILAFVVAIPIVVFCFGFIVTRRNQETEQSSDADGGGPRSAVMTDVVPADQTAGTSPVVRDGFGRGDGVTSGSFQMQKEMLKEGYFGDNGPSATASEQN